MASLPFSHQNISPASRKMKGVELRAGEKVIHLSEGYYVHHGGVLVRKLRDEELIEVERNAQPDNQEANTGAGDHQGLGSVLVSLSHERSQLEQTARQALNTHGGDVQRSADSAFETASKNVDQPAGVHSTVENTQPTSHGSDNVANVAMTDATPHPTHRTVGGLNVAQPSNFSVQSKKQTYYLPQGLLSKDYFTHIDSTAYNPLWIQDNNINPEVLAGFRSKIKMESMFGRGVFEIGDQFHLIGPRGIVCTAKEAIVLDFAATLEAFPDFCIHTVATGESYTLSGCNGVGELYRHMADQGPSSGSYLRVNYGHFQVTRNGQVLGKLSDLRQALHVFMAERDEWNKR